MRLVDADELIEHAWRDRLDSRELIVEMIEKAPTVKEIRTNIPLDIFERLLKQSQAVPIEVLQEIRQEIEERINNCGDGTFKDGLCEAFDIVYCKIKEFSE